MEKSMWKSEERTGRTKLHNEEIYNLCSSPNNNVIRVRKIGWVDI
jgi:hypothetical protein